MSSSPEALLEALPADELPSDTSVAVQVNPQRGPRRSAAQKAQLPVLNRYGMERCSSIVLGCVMPSQAALVAPAPLAGAQRESDSSWTDLCRAHHVLHNADCGGTRWIHLRPRSSILMLRSTELARQERRSARHRHRTDAQGHHGLGWRAGSGRTRLLPGGCPSPCAIPLLAI
jgi:hypothetical protein